jgi:CheY-like chemotaxis protein
MRVLAVVEDCEDNRDVLRALLEDRYELVDFEDGPAALQGVPSLLPDVILMDISLPGMDGVEVLSRLRREARLRHIPAIALTAHAMDGDRERLLAAGFDDYVAKPIVDENILIDAVERLVTSAV